MAEALPTISATVIWQVAGRKHELISASRRVLELGSTVLVCGAQFQSAGGEPEPLRWQVETALNPTELWHVRGPTGEILGACASAADAIRTVEYAALQQLFAADSSVTTLHAALLSQGRGGILIVGPAESGKSTLATALWLAGFSFHGDDIALMDPDGGGLSAAPRRVSLRQPSRRLLGDELWQRLAATPSFMPTSEGCLFHPHELAGQSLPGGSLEPSLILFLARRGVELGAAELRPLSPAELLVALAPYSNVVRTTGMEAALRRLQPLAERAPAYDLGRGPLPSMLAAISALLPPEPPRS
jgi:hypothetical protein